MKKMMKKMSALFAGVLLVGTLTACAEQFDASAYVKAILDNSYYNDSTGIVELGIGTAEEASAIYEEGIDAQMDAMLDETVVISDELYNEYRQFYIDLYSSVKYTVGEAVEVDDETFEVTVTYEKMNMFEEAVVAYEAVIVDYVTAWTEAVLAGEEAPSDEEMTEVLFAALKDCMVAELADATYDEPATATIRVELVDNVWTPNEEDLLNLEYLLFDFEGLYELQ